MSLTVEDVQYIASLARLRFSEAEQERLAREMSSILDYMAKLEELDTSDVEPMAHVLPLSNVYRPDAAAARITREEALRNAPDADEAFFRVPKVIE